MSATQQTDLTRPKVAVVRYDTPLESVRKAVELSGSLAAIPASAKVFVKPNVLFWVPGLPFPKWGVITTSRVVQDMVAILRERGIDDITIGEGLVVYDPKDKETPQQAFEGLGYSRLKERYGVKVINCFERPFEKVDLGEGVQLNFNVDALGSDFIVNLPVMKTHGQTMVSLGIKNLKGLIDIPSRKKCHSADPEKDLHFMISRLSDRMPPCFTLLDGIFTNERGPGFGGKMRRSNILIASWDILAADLVGAKILGYEPIDVPHLVHAARSKHRSLDLADIELVGEKIDDVALKLEYDFDYNQDKSLPKFMEKMGIKGLSYPKYDLSLCTYCFVLNGVVIQALSRAWKGEPWGDVEVLTGKLIKPSGSSKKTILLGKCMYEANKNDPAMKEVIAIKTCPPSPDAVADALIQAGIPVEPEIIRHPELSPAFAMPKYIGKPEFDESLFQVE